MTSASGSGAAPDVRHKITFALNRYCPWHCSCGEQFSDMRDAERHEAEQAGRQAARESLAALSAPAAPEAPSTNSVPASSSLVVGVAAPEAPQSGVCPHGIPVFDSCAKCENGIAIPAPDVAATLSEDDERTYLQLMHERNRHPKDYAATNAALRSVLVERERYKTENAELVRMNIEAHRMIEELTMPSRVTALREASKP